MVKIMNQKAIITQIDQVTKDPGKFLPEFSQFIQGYIDQDDSYLIVLNAFYCSLSYKEQWKTYSKTQYKKACKVLKAYLMKPEFDEKSIFFALDELEKAGFNINPFEIDYFEDD